MAIAALVLLAVLSFSLLPDLLHQMRHLEQYQAHPAVGQRLPALKLAPLTGNAGPATLESLSGRVVVLNFWGTWCPPCRMEFPHLVELYERYRERPDFQILAVSSGQDAPEDTEELRGQTQAFLDQFQYDIPTYSDPDFETRLGFRRMAGSLALPTTLVMDRDGLIRGVWPGFHPDFPKQIETLVRSLLEAGPPVRP